MSSEPERKFQKDNPVAYAAWEMAQVYDANRNENGSVTETGFIHLNHLFGKVPENQRADVFIAFISMLDERGIDYDVSEFATERPLH